MTFKLFSTSTVFLLALGGAAATACGGSVDIDFIGTDKGGGDDPACGDGTIADDEACDDDNTDAGDGCSDACAIEAGFSCTDEPSECARTVGNGDLDEGETCDDGNVEAGDGCSDTGQIEGSCDAPVLIELEADADGILSARVESSTSGGGSQLDAAECAGNDAGAGPDRIFQIDVPRTADLRVRVESTFNPIVRLLNAPCDIAEERSCSDDGGVGTTEDLRITGLPAGTYYISVDGAQSGQRGDFTLRVDGACPLDNLRLQRISFGTSDFTLENRSSECAINLDSVSLGVDVNGSTSSSDLPEELLEPGEKYIISRYAGDHADVTISTMVRNNPASTAAYLCRGTCDFEDGSNVIDAVTSGGTIPPSLYDELTFTPAPLSDLTYYPSWISYERVTFDGETPDFLAADWAVKGRFDVNLAGPGDLTVYSYSATTIAPQFVVADDQDYGQVVILTPGDASHGGHYLNTSPLSTPSYIRMRFKPVAASNNTCFLTAETAAPDTGNILFRSYVDEAQVVHLYNGTDNYNIGTIDVDTWHSVEFRNIDWVARTFDPYVDGVAGPSAWSFPATGTAAFLSLGNNSSGQCTVGEVYIE